MPYQYRTEHGLPRLVNGRRYSHELENPKPIPVDIRSDVLQLLRNYHAEVCLSVPTLSESSRTSAPARSEASTGTSITEMTFAFSASNGSVQRESARRPLDSLQRTRKALVRKLQACLEDCRKRKVKCPLWHHSLRDLLEIEHEPHDEAIIEWAIRVDAESHTPVATTPVSARVDTLAAGGMTEERNEVLHRAASVFNLLSDAPMPYGQVIQETDASLLEYPELVSPRPLAHREAIVAVVQSPYTYRTFKTDLMFPLGTRDDIPGPARYRCQFPSCEEILPMEDLISHFEVHFYYEHLNDPLRMACPTCDNFYASSIDRCLPFHGPLQERVYGQYFPSRYTMDMQLETSAIHSGSSEYGSFNVQGLNWSSYQGSDSFLPSSSFSFGSSIDTGGRYYSVARSVLSNFAKSLLILPTIPQPLFRPLVRRRGFIVALAITATVSLVLSYKSYNWIVANLTHLIYGVSAVSLSKLPAIGVAFASAAFGLHRFIVHAYRINRTRCGGWLPRCALNMINVACGRRRPESPSYQLDHLRQRSITTDNSLIYMT